ncbi:MAG: hypothetical protein J5625_00545 [Lachnospiraceae bacterium]|nr:hypothetical protein [Lachnospiraceae bacterium]
MAYVVRATEKVRGIGADYETKALLYLMNYRDDSNEIDFFAIDFYNDVTGLDLHANKAWDVQSKGKKGSSAKEIGRELVTLFKNYMSELHFDYLILFIAEVPESFREDSSKNVFGIDNIKKGALNSVRDGLVDETKKRNYTNDNWIDGGNIDSFLQTVTFVVDDKSKAEYIRGIIKVNPNYIPQDKILDGIFNKIRDVQASKKNNEPVEGEEVNQLRDVFLFDRIIKAKEIRLMVLNSFINYDVINSPVPISFYQLLQRFDGIRQNEIIEDCKLNVSKILYDKTFTDEFWDLLDTICETISNNKNLSVKQTFDGISHLDIVNNPRLDDYTVQYLISVMKEALQ